MEEISHAGIPFSVRLTSNKGWQRNHRNDRVINPQPRNICLRRSSPAFSRPTHYDEAWDWFRGDNLGCLSQPLHLVCVIKRTFEWRTAGWKLRRLFYESLISFNSSSFRRWRAHKTKVLITVFNLITDEIFIIFHTCLVYTEQKFSLQSKAPGNLSNEY